MSATRTLMIVEPGLKLWGSERALAATLKALTEAWARVVLVVPPGAELADEVIGKSDAYGPVEIVYAPIGNLHKRGRAAQVRALLMLTVLTWKLRPKRMYLNQAGLGRLLLPVARLLGVPLALHVRLLEDVPRVIALRGTVRAPLDLIFISDAMEEAAGDALLPAHTRRLKAYDVFLLAPQPAPQLEVASFANVGRLSHAKGMHLLVEALGQAGLLDASAHFYGAGVEGDDYAVRLKQQAQPLGNRIRFMGFRRDVPQCLPAYRFMVSTSRYESLGRVVMEAWEAGLVPIVYAASGGAVEIVRKSGGGLIFDDWTAEGLAQILYVALKMSDDDHRAMSAAGRAWAERRLGLNNYRAALSGVLF